MNRKILIIAGTHQREIEFSHAVADLLLTKYHKNTELPEFSTIGSDGATQAQVWDTDTVTIAKIYSVSSGEPEKYWLESQSLQRLDELADYKLMNAKVTPPPRVAETFERNSQWTSVHNILLEKYNPLFFIDLHSYHEDTRGIEGKGLQINSHADKKLNRLMQEALTDAQINEPDIYGEYRETTLQSDKEIQEKLLSEYFTKNELIKIITNDKDRMSAEEFYRKRSELSKKIRCVKDQEYENRFEHGWFFTTFGRPLPQEDHFVFEAKYWCKNQQEAVAKFITTYLISGIQQDKTI